MNLFRLLGQYPHFHLDQSLRTAHHSPQATSLTSHQSSYSCAKYKHPALAEVCPSAWRTDAYALNVASTGISFKTQALYVTVFITRYLDLFFPSQLSLYNIVMKVFFIGSSVYTLFLMKVRFRYVAI